MYTYLHRVHMCVYVFAQDEPAQQEVFSSKCVKKRGEKNGRHKNRDLWVEWTYMYTGLQAADMQGTFAYMYGSLAVMWVYTRPFADVGLVCGYIRLFCRYIQDSFAGSFTGMWGSFASVQGFWQIILRCIHGSFELSSLCGRRLLLWICWALLQIYTEFFSGNVGLFGRYYRVAKMHRMPCVAVFFSQKSH